MKIGENMLESIKSSLEATDITFFQVVILLIIAYLFFRILKVAGNIAIFTLIVIGLYWFLYL